MEEAFLSERNSYLIDTDDPGVATAGYSEYCIYTYSIPPLPHNTKCYLKYAACTSTARGMIIVFTRGSQWILWFSVQRDNYCIHQRHPVDTLV